MKDRNSLFQNKQQAASKSSAPNTQWAASTNIVINYEIGSAKWVDQQEDEVQDIALGKRNFYTKFVKTNAKDDEQWVLLDQYNKRKEQALQKRQAAIKVNTSEGERLVPKSEFDEEKPSTCTIM